MHSWRVVLVCALVAFLATASAEDVAQCEKDGAAEGAKVGAQVFPKTKASCETGERPPIAMAGFYFPEPCGKAFFTACLGAVKKVEPYASYKGNPKCELSYFRNLYDAKTSMSCSNAAPKEAPQDESSSPEDTQDVGSGPTIDEPHQTETP